MTMIKAVMLIKSGGRVPKGVGLAKQLKTLEFVVDSYAVFGRFDVVAFLEAADVKKIFRSVSEATNLEGIVSSETVIEVTANQESHDDGKGPFAN